MKLIYCIMTLLLLSVVVEAKDYYQLRNAGSSLIWDLDLPDHAVGVELIIVYSPSLDEPELTKETKRFKSSDPVVYPFLGDDETILKEGSYNWEMKPIYEFPNKVGFSKTEVSSIHMDENGRNKLIVKSNLESITLEELAERKALSPASGSFHIVSGVIKSLKEIEESAQ